MYVFYIDDNGRARILRLYAFWKHKQMILLSSHNHIADDYFVELKVKLQIFVHQFSLAMKTNWLQEPDWRI